MIALEDMNAIDSKTIELGTSDKVSLPQMVVLVEAHFGG
jgi:hypothetical protein